MSARTILRPIAVAAALLSFAVAALADSPPPPPPAVTDAITVSPTTPVEVELHQKLRRPSGTRGAWQLFFFLGKTKAPYQVPGSMAPSVVEYDVTAYVEAKIENGRAVALRASHVTSY